METWHVIIIILAILTIAILVLAHCCFDDRDEDQFWYDNYQGAERPHVSLNEPCKHTGEKSLICEWTICGCEKVNTYCDECGEMIIEGNVEC